MTAEATVVHTYAVTDATPVTGVGADAAVDTGGIGGAPLRRVEVADVAVVTARLDVGRFGPEQWRRHGTDPAWVGPLAQAHHHVVAGLCAADPDAAVVPLRLPGIYRDDDAMAAAVTGRLDSLRRALDRVRGHREWGVKVYAGAPETGEPEPEPPLASGRDYLRRRAEQVQTRQTRVADRRTLVVACHEALAGVAAASVTSLVLDRTVSGRTEPMLLNSAHLVSRRDESRFLATVRAEAEGLSRSGLRVEPSGPWPPYSFADAAAADGSDGPEDPEGTGRLG